MDTKTMQDKTPNDVLCSECGMVLVKAEKFEWFRERDIFEIEKRHYEIFHKKDKNIFI